MREEYNIEYYPSRTRLVLRTADANPAYAYHLNTDKYRELSGLNTAVYGNFFSAYTKLLYAERHNNLC